MRYVGRIALVLLLAARAAAAGPGLTADANIVTAIDGSDSVSGADMRLQLRGLAAAMRDPALLARLDAVAGRILRAPA